AGLLGILLTPIQARALESLNGRKALASALTMLIAVTFFHVGNFSIVLGGMRLQEESKILAFLG
ncbi:MAG: hypothetical protein ACKOA8_05785, partial [Deltaproteobacteria bacterium]